MRVARRELMSVNVWQHCDAVKTKIVISAALALAAELGFNGDFRAWEHLLRIHE
jgi:hypothetical protein